jgi:ribose/xylose/arabinose/galactoside ABC-type transport system permease subunit
MAVAGRLNEYRALALLALFAVLFAAFVPGFYTAANLRNLAVAVGIDGIIVVGMTFVMVTGGLDLSVGSVMALSGVVMMALQPYGDATAAAAALLAALAVGLVNGWLICHVRINPFVATLATMIVVRGLALTLTGAAPISGTNYDLVAMIRAPVLGVPLPALVCAAFVLAGGVLLRRFPFGRHVYAIGGNETASRQAGLNVGRTKFACYCISALCAGVAGLILSLRLNTGSPIIGDNTALYVIAAALLGGVSLRGGTGSVMGALCGAAAIATIANAMTVVNVPAYYQRIAIGALLLALVVADAWLSGREAETRDGPLRAGARGLRA